MNLRTTLLLASVAVLVFTACGTANGTDPAVDCSSTDGQTACSDSFCPANQFCSQVLCLAGCQSSANCEAGSYCDKSGVTAASGAGVCRACGVAAGADSGASCSNVAGNYRLALTPGNPDVCQMLPLPSSAISVTESGSTATWTLADGDQVTTLWTCEIDSAVCVCDGSFSLGGASGLVSWKTQAGTLTASAMGVVCNFTVDRQ